MRDLPDQIEAWAAEAARSSSLEPITVEEVTDERKVLCLEASTGSGRRDRGRLAVLGAAAAITVIALVAVLVSQRSTDSSRTVRAGESDGSGWSRIGEAPLSPRTSAGVYWTGTEVLVIGGTERRLCPPNASCIATKSALRDGAAYDPTRRTWKRIANVPKAMILTSGAMVDGSLYIMGVEPGLQPPTGDQPRSQFVRFDPDANTWSELAPPDHAINRTFVADGGRLVAYVGTHESSKADLADQVWDPAKKTWSDLPRDPLAPSYDRSMVSVGGKLYLFAKDLVPNPGADGPSLVRGAVLDGSTWHRLPESESIGYGAVATDDVIMSPARGGADGGKVGNYGRSYPFRWLFDTTAQQWQDSPEPPEASGQPDLGIIAGGGNVVANDAVFDVHDRTWSGLDAPAALDRQLMSTAWAGDRLVVFGGAADATLHNDLWQWIPKPTSTDESTAKVSGAMELVGGPAGTPPAPAPGPVSATDQKGNVVAKAQTDDQGRFTLRLPPGTYRISGRSEKYQNGDQPCTADEDTAVSTGGADDVQVRCQMR